MAGGQSATQTVRNEPWSGAKPYMQDLYKVAQGAFNNYKPYTGPVYAGPNQTQKDAVTAIQGLAPGYDKIGQDMAATGTGYSTAAGELRGAAGNMRAGADPVRALAGDTVSGKYLDHRSNPYLSGAVEAAQHDTFRNFWENTMPQLKSGALANGTYGGDRTDLIFSRAAEGAMSDAMRQANQIYYGNYSSERDRQMQAPRLYSDANALDMQGITALSGAADLDQRAVQAGLSGLGVQLEGPQLLGKTGDQLQSWDQAAIDAEMRKWEIDNNSQWEPIMRMLSVLNGGGFSNQTSTVPRSASMFQGAAGGGMLGYQAGQSMGIDPRMMALIMSALGGASGY